MDTNNGKQANNRGIGYLIQPTPKRETSSPAHKRASAVQTVTTALEGFSGVERVHVLEAALLCLQDPEDPGDVQEAIEFLRARSRQRQAQAATETPAPAHRRWWR